MGIGDAARSSPPPCPRCSQTRRRDPVPGGHGRGAMARSISLPAFRDVESSGPARWPAEWRCWRASSSCRRAVRRRSMPTGSYGGNEWLPVFLAGVQEEAGKGSRKNRAPLARQADRSAWASRSVVVRVERSWRAAVLPVVPAIRSCGSIRVPGSAAEHLAAGRLSGPARFHVVVPRSRACGKEKQQTAGCPADGRRDPATRSRRFLPPKT